MRYFYFLLIPLLISSKLIAQDPDSLQYRFDSLYRSGDYEKAEEVARLIIQTTRVRFGEKDSSYALGLYNLGVLYRVTGEYGKADSLLQLSLDIREKIFGRESIACANSLNELGVNYIMLARYAEAEKVLQEASAIDRKLLGENNPDYATDLGNLAYLYRITGRADQAEPLLLKCCEITRKANGAEDLKYATHALGLADLYHSLSQYIKAEELYLQVLDIFRKKLPPDHTDLATCMNNLALMYQKMGEYAKAEPLYLRAIEIDKKALGEHNPGFANELNNLATFYQDIGQYQRAMELSKRSIAIKEKTIGKNHPEYADDLNTLARSWLLMGEPAKAVPLLKQALEIYKKGPGPLHPNYANELNNLGGVYQTMGLYAKAEPLYLEARDILKKKLGENHTTYAVCLGWLARNYALTGRYTEAEQLYRQGLQIRVQALGENNVYTATSYNNLANLYLTMKQYAQAEECMEKSAAIDTKNLFTLFSILSDKEKGTYLRKESRLINDGNSLLWQNKQASPAFTRFNFNQQLLLKSLTLADSRIVLESIRHSTDSLTRSVYESWLSVKSRLARQYSLPLARRRKDLPALEDSSEMIEKEMARLSAGFRDHQSALRLSMEDLQKNMDEEEAAVEFIRFKPVSAGKDNGYRYAAYILGKHDSIPRFVPLFEETKLLTLLKKTGMSATRIAQALYKPPSSSKREPDPARALYQLAWAPLEPFLKNIRIVSYSPAGQLYSIAFHALPADSNRLLGDRYTLRQYTAIRQLAKRDNRPNERIPGSIALFGNPEYNMDSLQLVQGKEKRVQAEISISTSVYSPLSRGNLQRVWPALPGTALEADRIRLLFSAKALEVKDYFSKDASEENFKALSGHSPGVLHLATHGFFLNNPARRMDQSADPNTYQLAEDPLLRSGLVMAGANYCWSGKTVIDGVEDGILTAYEISQLDLSHTELAVLSACESGLGDIQGNEGVYGLQRAFKMAGVKKMIVSLWKVPDKETAELMTTFYSNWLKGQSIEDAFGRAQAEMRKKYPPFYWAAFVLVE